jgi:hypothetical protein
MERHRVMCPNPMFLPPSVNINTFMVTLSFIPCLVLLKGEELSARLFLR